ncbi:MAG TPA: DUF6067 family protein [Candidatus Hydrogenedentes bacterium]|nr:DUF6067 family protein [Candidatus Hydrogenedentota bacterium]
MRKPCGMIRSTVLTMAIAVSTVCFAQVIEVPNASFEQGQDGPEGWALSGGSGTWLEGEASEGSRAIQVTGTGNDTNYWQSAPLSLEPSSVYVVTFDARSWGGDTGTAISGPHFCNRDLGSLTEDWASYSSVFFTPATMEPGAGWLRFGQWQVGGAMAFDNVSVSAAQPLYAEKDGICLGEGERIDGNVYEFAAPHYSVSRNQSRPLIRHQCHFNTNRWSFGSGSELVYRHHVAGRNQTKAGIEVSISYYAGGRLVAEASRDGQAWHQFGEAFADGAATFPIPDALFPAGEIYVRLRGMVQDAAGGNSGPCSFTLNTYTCRATLDGAPVTLRGETTFVAVTAADAKVKAAIESIGDAMPGGDNTIRLRIENGRGGPVAARPSVTVIGEGGKVILDSPAVQIPAGASTLEIPYELPGSGAFVLECSLGPGVAFAFRADLYVPHLFETGYGERVPGSTDTVTLWRASSGWRIARTRPAPSRQAEAVEVRLARNETEAVQLVISPQQTVKGLTVTPSELEGPGGAKLPASAVEVLRVRYVDVQTPTDETGVAAPWPDPLPPLRGPIEVAAGENQPMWVRVKTPESIPAGVYRGTLRIQADGLDTETPLHVEVYDFALPERMTCVSAFGFSPGLVFNYQKLTQPEQQRAVMDKYLANFSEHRISPYDPTPMDDIGVSWAGLPKWQGGSPDTETKHAGNASRYLDDPHANLNVSMSYADPMAIPEKGLRLRFWYKTNQPGQQFLVSLRHFDAGGAWMSGRNRDIVIGGDGTWQEFERVITEFPEGARTVAFAAYPTTWADAGDTTGSMWYDDIVIEDAGTGQALAEGGDLDETAPDQIQPVFDWAGWDAAMAHAIDELGFNSFQLPVMGLGGGTFHSRSEPSLLGYAEDTPQYQHVFRAYLQGLQEHLREKGWLGESYVYWFDEPDPKDYEFVMNGFRKLKENAPDINRMLTEQVEPELIGGPNIWCPLTPAYNYDVAEERRASGDMFWWYVCTGPKAPYATLFIDHPATELRVWLWQTWENKVQGILVWQSNYWTSDVAYPDSLQNPYEDPMGWVSGYSTPAGTRHPWGNGDGRFIYPPEAAAGGNPPEPVLEGPVDSIRWEMLRDGVEDYEYFVILAKLFASRREQIPVTERSVYEGLLEIPDNISKSLTEFTKDPAPLEARRDAIARAIVKLLQMG